MIIYKITFKQPDVELEENVRCVGKGGEKVALALYERLRSALQKDFELENFRYQYHIRLDKVELKKLSPKKLAMALIEGIDCFETVTEIKKELKN